MASAGRSQVRAPSLTRLLRLALERAADDQLGLSFDVTSLRQSMCTLEKLADVFPQDALLGILEGNAQGAVAVDVALFSGLVEFQTIGTVLPTVPKGRSATRVDAALIAPVLDVALAGFDESVADTNHAPWAQGYVFGAMVADMRALLLTLSARVFHLFEIEVSLSNGARGGTMMLAFADSQKAVSGAEKPNASGEGTEALRQAVLSSQATFSAVVGRLSVPLHQLQDLKVGEALVLPAGSLRETRLEASGGDHATPVILGQLNGFRAVRLKGGAPQTEGATAESPGAEQVASAPAKEIEVPVKTPAQQVAVRDNQRFGAGESFEDLDDLFADIDTGAALGTGTALEPT